MFTSTVPTSTTPHTRAAPPCSRVGGSPSDPFPALALRSVLTRHRRLNCFRGTSCSSAFAVSSPSQGQRESTHLLSPSRPAFSAPCRFYESLSSHLLIPPCRIPWSFQQDFTKDFRFLVSLPSAVSHQWVHRWACSLPAHLSSQALL